MEACTHNAHFGGIGTAGLVSLLSDRAGQKLIYSSDLERNRRIAVAVPIRSVFAIWRQEAPRLRRVRT